MASNPGRHTSARPDNTRQAQRNFDAQTRQKPAADFYLLNDQHMFRRILAAAQAFAGGAPQHDDMTLVVLRIA
jgi:serine phosphatase RsbU (regulator of sigma subunit)